MVLDSNLDTIKSIRAPDQMKGYEIIEDKLNLVEQRLLTAQSDQHNLLTHSAVQLFQAACEPGGVSDHDHDVHVEPRCKPLR